MNDYQIIIVSIISIVAIFNFWIGFKVLKIIKSFQKATDFTNIMQNTILGGSVDEPTD
jgi:hypothetical protein